MRISDTKDPSKNVTVYRTVRECKEGDREAYDAFVVKELERKLGKETRKKQNEAKSE